MIFDMLFSYMWFRIHLSRGHDTYMDDGSQIGFSGTKNHDSDAKIMILMSVSVKTFTFDKFLQQKKKSLG